MYVLKASGQNSDVITESTTIYEILEKMAKIGMLIFEYITVMYV